MNSPIPNARRLNNNVAVKAFLDALSRLYNYTETEGKLVHTKERATIENGPRFFNTYREAVLMKYNPIVATLEFSDELEAKEFAKNPALRLHDIVSNTLPLRIVI